MKLYFKTKPNKNGNILQLVIDTETNTAKKGYFIFSLGIDAITIDKKQLEKIFAIIENERIFKGV